DEELSMRTIYLHLGYHKTATTFLQQSIYPKLEHVNYIKKKRIRRALNQIRLKSKMSEEDIRKISNRIEVFDNGQPLLISNEAFSASAFAPNKTKKQAKVLKDLRRIFPESAYDVYIIVGIREQVALLTSLYVQSIHHGGVLSGPDYIKYLEHNE